MRQDTLGLAPILRSLESGEDTGDPSFEELVKANVVQTLRTNPVKAPRPPTAKDLLRPNQENSLRPLREGRTGAYTGDLEEGLNRRGARNLILATGRLDEMETRASSRRGNTGSLRRPRLTLLSERLGDSVEGLNRRGARSLRRGHRSAVGGGLDGNTGQSYGDSARWKHRPASDGGDTSLVSGRGWSRSPGVGSLGYPSCKTRSACYEETRTGNAKRVSRKHRGLRLYAALEHSRGVVHSSHRWL